MTKTNRIDDIITMVNANLGFLCSSIRGDVDAADRFIFDGLVARDVVAGGISPSGVVTGVVVGSLEGLSEADNLLISDNALEASSFVPTRG
jgi:hypothetical protein